jgi:hypothetical protein
MNTYLSAPATTMLATNCACCGKALLDAVSVETGVGPDCRRKHGYEEAQGPSDMSAAAFALIDVWGDEVLEEWTETERTPRQIVNSLVHAVARLQTGPQIAPMIAAIAAMGFTTLAARIADRVGVVRIEVAEDGALVVRAPYNPDHVNRMRRVPGRKFIRETKGGFDRVPASSKRDLWAALRASFAGLVAFGPKGAFIL